MPRNPHFTRTVKLKCRVMQFCPKNDREIFMQ